MVFEEIKFISERGHVGSIMKFNISTSCAKIGRQFRSGVTYVRYVNFWQLRLKFEGMLELTTKLHNDNSTRTYFAACNEIHVKYMEQKGAGFLNLLDR